MIELRHYPIYTNSLEELPSGKLLINTINAHSFNEALKDVKFTEALNHSDVLLPDGISVVGAVRLLTGQKLKKIAGEDLFEFEMRRLEKIGCTTESCTPDNGKPIVLFLGSTEDTLKKIQERAGKEYPNVEVHVYSPPFKKEFSDEDNLSMIQHVNTIHPDVLYVGMTAPKQEKWAYQHFRNLNAGHVCCIGAVFDFYAGTVKRAPKWIIKLGLEWFYRLVKEPRRMWKRYMVGNFKFIYEILIEMIQLAKR